MFVIEDVVLAVSQAAAVGAVPKLHLGMGNIGFAAYRALVERLLFPGELPRLGDHAAVAGFYFPDDVPSEE